MTDPLTPADLERMRREHADQNGVCFECWDRFAEQFKDWPCDAALLLAEFTRMWLAGLPLMADTNTTTAASGVVYGLFGSSTTEEFR